MGDIFCHCAAWSAHNLVDLIARRCRVSDVTVAKYRDEISERHLRNSEDSTRTVERGAWSVERGDNVILPKVGSDPDKLTQAIKKLKENGYIANVVHMRVSPYKAWHRSIGQIGLRAA